MPDARVRPARSRPSIPISKTWDGRLDSFPAYKRMVKGHLLQVGAGYMLQKDFLEKYEELGESYFYLDAFYYWYKVSSSQAAYNCTYFYGTLITTFL